MEQNLTSLTQPTPTARAGSGRDATHRSANRAPFADDPMLLPGAAVLGPFRLPAAQNVLDPSSWGEAEVDLPHALQLIRGCCEALCSGGALEHYAEAAKEILSRRSLVKVADLPQSAINSDRVFGVERVNGDPLSGAAAAAVIGTIDLLRVLSAGEQAGNTAVARERLGLILSHLGNAAANLTEALDKEIGSFDRLRLQIPGAVEPIASERKRLQTVHRIVQAIFRHYARRSGLARKVISTWLAAHHLYYVVLDFTAMTILASKQLARRDEHAAAVPLIMCAQSLFADSRELFDLATPKGFLYLSILRPWMIRFAPGISGADSGDHGAMLAALRAEPWPEDGVGAGMQLAQQGIRNAYSAAFTAHVAVCNRAAHGGTSVRTQLRHGQHGAGRPAAEILESLRQVRVDQSARAGRCPVQPQSTSTLH